MTRFEELAAWFSPLARGSALARVGAWTALTLAGLSRVVPGAIDPTLDLIAAAGFPGYAARARKTRTFVPEQAYLDPEEVLCIPLAWGARRGFRTDIPPRRPGEVRLAWVGGSSLRVGDRDAPASYLPDLVRARLRGRLARDPRVHLYLLSAARIYDKYVCVLHALEGRPDLLILTVNPIFDLLDRAISFRAGLHTEAVRLVPWKAPDLGMLLALASPRRLMDGLLGGAFPGALWEPRGLPPPRVVPPRLGDRVKQPLDFWIEHELGTRGQSPLLRQREVLAGFLDPDSDGPASTILVSILRACRDAGTPLLVQLAPVAPALREAAPETLRAVRSRLVSLVEAHGGTRARFVALPREAPLGARHFRDGVHLRAPAPAPLVEVLAAAVGDSLREGGAR